MEQPENTTAEAITDICSQLAEARDALRRSQDTLSSERDRAEFEFLERTAREFRLPDGTKDPERYAKATKAIGTNERDRERAYAIACESDEAYCTWRETVREQQFKVALLEGVLEGLKATRREREHVAFERYLDIVGDRPAVFNLPHLRELAS